MKHGDVEPLNEMKGKFSTYILILLEEKKYVWSRIFRIQEIYQ